MKPAPFTYHDPEHIDDLIALLSEVDDAKILAGGQSLLPMLNLRFLLPDHVIDINKIQALQFIGRQGNDLMIGAMTRQKDLLQSDTVRSACPVMQVALQYVGHFQTRNRGTLGGSLCHLDPSAELAAIASLYNAKLTLRGPDGSRNVNFDEWPLAYMTPNLGPNEVLEKVNLPLWEERHGHAFVEFQRRHGDFAIVAVGCLLAVDGSGSITRVALTVAGANVKPQRLTTTETALIGQPTNTATFAAAAAEAAKLDAMSDAYISREYRRKLAGALVKRALVAATASATGVPAYA
ncbi:MAG: FAD binding domain-containing protein [Gammaproteobacteria bacterium]|nr:FAD binding domain-containing protein [Gammaproteobacteria bacterium]MDH3410955.1 FAD binding domain-containing protein [Gammaproteobacteria bacterium]